MDSLTFNPDHNHIGTGRALNLVCADPCSVVKIDDCGCIAPAAAANNYCEACDNCESSRKHWRGRPSRRLPDVVFGCTGSERELAHAAIVVQMPDRPEWRLTSEGETSVKRLVFQQILTKSSVRDVARLMRVSDVLPWVMLPRCNIGSKSERGRRAEKR